MAELLYISSSQFSGTTLLSFLLNLHPDICTTGHPTGFEGADESRFYCSCGQRLSECPFYKRVEADFEKEGLAFHFQNFGTDYKISNHDRLNQYLTTNLPLLRASVLEKSRDRLLRKIPGLSQQFDAIDRANVIFVRTALDHHHARVFLYNSHDPYRLRQLGRIGEFKLRNIHQVRDPRGVVLSMMTHSGWDAISATQAWIRKQEDILRISAEMPETLMVFYEDICTDVNKEMARIHAFLGLSFVPYTGDFKEGEHHILGNAMRRRSGQITLDRRWESDLSAADKQQVVRTISKWSLRKNIPFVAEISSRYLSSV